MATTAPGLAARSSGMSTRSRKAGEHRRIGGALDGHGGGHAAHAQGAEHGQAAPSPGGGRPVGPLAPGRASMAAHHGGGHAGLIEEHQPMRVDGAEALDECRPLGPDVVPVLLVGAQSLFFSSG